MNIFSNQLKVFSPLTRNINISKDTNESTFIISQVAWIIHYALFVIIFSSSVHAFYTLIELIFNNFAELLIFAQFSSSDKGLKHSNM